MHISIMYKLTNPMILNVNLIAVFRYILRKRKKNRGGKVLELSFIPGGKPFNKHNQPKDLNFNLKRKSSFDLGFTTKNFHLIYFSRENEKLRENGRRKAQ